MVAEPISDYRNEILERLEDRLAEGESLDNAVAAVYGLVISNGESECFVREFGAQAIRDLWRCANRQSRGQILSIGTRRHDLSSMTEEETLLDALYKIGDDWVCLGDCTKPMCEGAAGFFKRQAYGNMREAFMFERLAAKLKGAQIVRTRFSEDQIMAILEEFKLE